jgi:protein N-terminal methyltransferase
VGAGIGRVSAGLLLHHFSRVSLLEANSGFLARAQETIAGSRLGTLFPMRLGDWTHQAGREQYDLVWIQWVIIYASDGELVAFLRQAAAALKPGGRIGLKDNMLTRAVGRPVYDEQDHSVCRTCGHLEGLFRQAGLRVLAKEQQADMPRHLFPVWMYMLQPEGTR